MAATEDLGIEGIVETQALDIEGSAIYRARQVLHNRLVAIKVLDRHQEPLIPRRFDPRRIRLQRFAEDDGVVKLYDTGVTIGGERYIVMPFFRAGSLADQLAHGPMPWHRAAELVMKTAEIVAKAHDLGVVLGDLKPSSVLLADASSPLVSVYGMASRRIDDGTPSYRAPDAGRGVTPTPAADVYSLSLILAALIAGRPPNRGPVSREFLAEIEALAPDRIVDVLGHGLAEEHGDRYTTARGLAGALRGAIGGDVTLGVPPPAPGSEAFDLDAFLATAPPPPMPDEAAPAEPSTVLPGSPPVPSGEPLDLDSLLEHPTSGRVTNGNGTSRPAPTSPAAPAPPADHPAPTDLPAAPPTASHDDVTATGNPLPDEPASDLPDAALPLRLPDEPDDDLSAAATPDGPGVDEPDTSPPNATTPDGPQLDEPDDDLPGGDDSALTDEPGDDLPGGDDSALTDEPGDDLPGGTDNDDDELIDLTVDEEPNETDATSVIELNGGDFGDPSPHLGPLPSPVAPPHAPPSSPAGPGATIIPGDLLTTEQPPPPSAADLITAQVEPVADLAPDTNGTTTLDRPLLPSEPAPADPTLTADTADLPLPSDAADNTARSADGSTERASAEAANGVDAQPPDELAAMDEDVSDLEDGAGGDDRLPSPFLEGDETIVGGTLASAELANIPALTELDASLTAGPMPPPPRPRDLITPEEATPPFAADLAPPPPAAEATPPFITDPAPAAPPPIDATTSAPPPPDAEPAGPAPRFMVDSAVGRDPDVATGSGPGGPESRQDGPGDPLEHHDIETPPEEAESHEQSLLLPPPPVPDDDPFLPPILAQAARTGPISFEPQPHSPEVTLGSSAAPQPIPPAQDPYRAGAAMGPVAQPGPAIDEELPFRSFDRQAVSRRSAPSGLLRLLDPLQLAWLRFRRSLGGLLAVVGLAVVAGIVAMLVMRDLRTTNSTSGPGSTFSTVQEEGSPSTFPPTSQAPAFIEPPATHQTTTTRQVTTTAAPTTTTTQAPTTPAPTTRPPTTRPRTTRPPSTRPPSTRPPTTVPPSSITVKPPPTVTITVTPPDDDDDDPVGPSEPLIQDVSVRRVRARSARVTFDSSACVTATFSYAPQGGSATTVSGGSRCSDSFTLLLGTVTPPLTPGTRYTVTITASSAQGATSTESIAFRTLG